MLWTLSWNWLICRNITIENKSNNNIEKNNITIRRTNTTKVYKTINTYKQTLNSIYIYIINIYYKYNNYSGDSNNLYWCINNLKPTHYHKVTDIEVMSRDDYLSLALPSFLHQRVDIQCKTQSFQYTSIHVNVIICTVIRITITNIYHL